MRSENQSADLLLRKLSHPRSLAARLVCIPYAGGGAAIFHSWPASLPPDVEVRGVQLPGRQERLRERPLTSMQQILDSLEGALASLPDSPTVLFGHSFGALVCFELCRRLASCGRAPAAVVVAARRAPNLPRMVPPIYELSDDRFCEAIARRYGSRADLFRDPDLRAMSLPSLRADFEVLEKHEHLSSCEMHVPFTVLYGRQDDSVPPRDAAAWADVADVVQVCEVDAGHFFIDSHRSWVLQHVIGVLKDARSSHALLASC